MSIIGDQYFHEGSRGKRHHPDRALAALRGTRIIDLPC